MFYNELTLFDGKMMIKLDRSHAKAPGAIFFDFDDVCHLPNRDNIRDKQSYQVQQDGHLHGHLMCPEQLKKICVYAEEHHIPLYIITARPTSHKPYICKKINELTAFYYDGLGGFKRNNVYCLGVETFDEMRNRPHVATLRHIKLTEIQGIHQSELSYLPKTQVLFIDDELHNLDPVKQAGYATLLAKGEGNVEHLSTVLDFMHATIELPFLHNLGNYSILGKVDHLLTIPLNPTEYIEPAIEAEFQGQYWRKRMLPDFSALAQQSLEAPAQKAIIDAKLQVLSYSQSIFFTSNVKKISEHLLKNSLETFHSLEVLAAKDIIILLGSESRRKARPLLQALQQYSHLSVAVITMPADSGVDTQPLGHLQTLLGANNRLNQLLCFREGLQEFLHPIIRKKRLITCLAIENGIGVLPVEPIGENGRLQTAIEPLLSDDGKTYCFYDQAHLLFSLNGRTHYQVSQPMKIGYTFLDKNKEALMMLLENKPAYYDLQKKFSHEMIRRLKDPLIGSPFPICPDGSKTKTSDDCIQVVLQQWLHDFFSEKISMNQLKAEFSFFKRYEERYIEDNRMTSATIQQAYDKRFGLVLCH